MTRSFNAACSLVAIFLGAAHPLAGQAIDVEGLGFTIGSAEAPVQVVEFSDFACPFCREFHEQTFRTLHDGYIATGKVRWVYVTFASGHYPNSHIAAGVAECGGEQGQFEAVRDRLFEHQYEWKDVKPEDGAEPFLAYLDGLELDGGLLVECAESPRIAERLEHASDLAARVGVTGTPTYVIDGFPLTGALPAGVIAQVLDARLAQLSGNPP